MHGTGGISPAVALGGLIATVAVGILSVRAAARRTVDARTTLTSATVDLSAPASRAIDTESKVFAMRPGMLATGLASQRRRAANPRTIHTYRTRRDYPGAPPRIPHGLTPVEFREGACNTCHESGGLCPDLARTPRLPRTPSSVRAFNATLETMQ
jgi:nitrate reductase cytochrome c-type subunit